jgi:DNA-3-methyladenine glycosylase II
MRKAINHLKKSDPVMAAIIEQVGPCRMEFGEPTFHSLAEAILYQQLNGKAAVTIFKRFTDLAGDPLTPAGILKLTDTQMRAVGLSKQKTSYLRDLSEKTKAGLVEFERLPELSEEEVIQHLTQVKGIGVWTATTACRQPSRSITRSASGRSLRSWRRSPSPGLPTVPLHAGICGRAWT